MRAIVFDRHGSVDQLSLRDMPTPELGPRDALIKVHAASLNGFDPMIVAGTTELRTPFPMIPGGDVAGEIVALGPLAGERDPDLPDVFNLFDPARWKVGDRVLPFPVVPGEGMTGETRVGTCCEYVRFPTANLIPIPDEISYEDAVCLPIAYGTAYRMLHTNGSIRSGETVLILGATGGVGTCAVQLAKAAGAVVVAAGRDEWKVNKLKELGADHVIDTSKDDFIAVCHDLFGKPRLRHFNRGVDVVVNYIGGETWDRCLRVLRHGGRMLTCGATAGYKVEMDLRYVWSYEQHLIGSNGWSPSDQLLMLGLVAQGEVKPIIHAVRPLEETAAGIQDLIDRKFFGKIVIES